MENYINAVEWEEDIYRKAISEWGGNLQQLIAIEEMSELIKELIKFQRHGKVVTKNIVEEIADVKIMMDQLIMIYDCKNEVDEMKYKKLKRLENRLTK